MAPILLNAIESHRSDAEIDLRLSAWRTEAVCERDGCRLDDPRHLAPGLDELVGVGVCTNSPVVRIAHNNLHRQRE